MIDISGHLRDFKSEFGFCDQDRPLVINCCGYQKFITRNFSVCRRKGRCDYQILYVAKGSGTYTINGRKKKLSEGNLVLFSPYEPQIYAYDCADQPLIYWIHFTGREAKILLDKFRISSCFVGKQDAIEKIFHEMILEFQLKKTGFENIIEACFYKLMVSIYRYRENCSSQDFRQAAFLDPLILKLNQSYQEKWTVKRMADYLNLSEGHFAHMFKKSLNLTPMEYLKNLRISKAKDYLLESDLTIANIADLLGYEDPLYFSRLFRKDTGYSPRAYRKHHPMMEKQRLPSVDPGQIGY